MRRIRPNLDVLKDMVPLLKFAIGMSFLVVLLVTLIIVKETPAALHGLLLLLTLAWFFFVSAFTALMATRHLIVMLELRDELRKGNLDGRTTQD